MSAPVRTTDLGLASYLYALGHKIEVSQVTPIQRAFTFPASAAADEKAYFQGGAISARLYFAALRDVKILLHRPLRSDSISIGEDSHDR